MNVIVNGKPLAVVGGTAIEEFVVEKQLNPASIIIEYNDEILPLEKWHEIYINENDRLEIVSFVGGG